LTKTKHIVRSLIFALLAQGLFISGVLASDSKAPVNILIMVTDDQRWDQLGLVQAEQGDKARFPFIETPRLDALAAEGMRFRNAFVTTSLCSPSRSAILTGQYNHTNGIIDNFTPFTPRPTWATALQAAGYTTAYIGKWHHGEEQWERPGFDFVATYQGHGLYNDTTFKVSHRLWFDTKTTTKGYIDERSVDFAIEFLEDQPRDKPFAMMIGFKAVHGPFTPMTEHAQRYASETIQPPKNWKALPPWSDWKQPMPWRRPPPAPDVHKDILRTVDGIDKNVGRMLDALNELDLAKDTLVIFTSDNGSYLGEHGQGDKRSAYEESIRVPMIMRLPGVIKPGTVSGAMVLNIDLAPTILDLAQQDVPAAMQGKSMRPLFGGEPVPWREAFLYEYWQENTWWVKSGQPRVPTILVVRTPTYKLITYPDFEKWTELFDLEADPDEMRNLVGYKSATNRHIEMCNMLQQLLAETGYIAKPSPDQWLIGITNSYATYQAHARKPVASRHPPVLIPNC
jgi:N-acetylglucosamine-6-sulfatase